MSGKFVVSYPTISRSITSENIDLASINTDPNDHRIKKNALPPNATYRNGGWSFDVESGVMGTLPSKKSAEGLGYDVTLRGSTNIPDHGDVRFNIGAGLNTRGTNLNGSQGYGPNFGLNALFSMEVNWSRAYRHMLRGPDRLTLDMGPGFLNGKDPNTDNSGFGLNLLAQATLTLLNVDLNKKGWHHLNLGGKVARDTTFGLGSNPIGTISPATWTITGFLGLRYNLF